MADTVVDLKDNKRFCTYTMTAVRLAVYIITLPSFQFFLDFLRTYIKRLFPHIISISQLE